MTRGVANGSAEPGPGAANPRHNNADSGDMRHAL